jgi:trans-aconitate methyltransferase
MNPDDQKRILHYYQSALTEYGENDARSVHWSDQTGQQKRFLVLSQIADLNGRSVLDVGCGLGDLYKFFFSQNINADYTGIDIVPEFIVAARERFPNVQFEVKDISAETKTYDYVLASGVLSYKVADHKNYYFSLIKKMYDLSAKGLAFNMLNKDTHIDDATYAAYDINEIADYCKTFCDNVQIVVDYLPQDFTIYLYK